VALAVTLLLAAYAAMSYSASWEKGLTVDEGAQIAAGYNIWLHSDYRMEGGNGDFIRRWATLPLLVTRPKFDGAALPGWRAGNAYATAYSFFFQTGNRPESILRQTRAMVVLLGVALGLAVFVVARRQFGAVGGLISLGLFCFSPNMLAFGSIVSTDLSIALFLFVATGCVWGLLHEVTWRRLGLSFLAVGGAVLAKLSALALLPITAILIVVKLGGGRPLRVRWGARSRVLGGRWAQLGVFAALGLAHVLAAWAALWAGYGFRYAALPPTADATAGFWSSPNREPVRPAVVKTFDWLRAHHALPEGYLRGVLTLLANDDLMGSYMNGAWHYGGRVGFFPYAIWVKTPLAQIVLLGLALVLWGVVRWRRRRQRRSARAAPSLYALAPWLALIGAYLALALVQNLNIGHRHILPIYPAVYVLAGAAALAWASLAGRLVVAGLLGWFAQSSLAVRPHYLAYFGEQAGGPGQGYRRLVDSSLDWGQDLPGLKRWLAQHNPAGKEPVFLAYFGADEPSYHGIKAERLPGYPNWFHAPVVAPLRPGYYAISASILAGVYTSYFGPWTRESERYYWDGRHNFDSLWGLPADSAARRELLSLWSPAQWKEEFRIFEALRLARLCAWLRKKGPPPHDVGHSILIWHLDAAALREALHGPPVELVEGPPMRRR
jgi:hypothetical protein